MISLKGAGTSMGLGLKVLTSSSDIEKGFLLAAAKTLDEAFTRAINPIRERLSLLVTDTLSTTLSGPAGDAFAELLGREVIFLEFKPLRIRGSQLSGGISFGLLKESGEGSTRQLFSTIVADYSIGLGGKKGGNGKGASKAAFNLALNSIFQGSDDDNIFTRALETETVHNEITQIFEQELLAALS